MAIYPDSPRSVETSIAAAADLVAILGRLWRMALAAIREAGLSGLTVDELAARLDMDCWSIQPRTSELRRKGLIRDSGQRRANTTGKLAIVWIASQFSPACRTAQQAYAIQQHFETSPKHDYR